jgi:hypothetical protein
MRDADAVSFGTQPDDSDRLQHLDRLRTALVAWVIACHALLGYSAVGGWPYDEVNEVTFAPGTELLLMIIVGPSGLVIIGLFFFIAGLLTERSYRRHGWLRYIGGRVQRLGLPWLVSALALWPVAVWIAYRGAGRHVSLWWIFRHRDPFLDSGALWFALVLMIFSAVFATGTSLYERMAARFGSSRSGARRRGPGPLTVIRLGGVVGAISLASFVVRIGVPVHSGQVGDLHIWWWPQCLGMFLLGIAAGWDTHLPPRVRRGCGVAALVTLAVAPVLAVASGLRDDLHGVGPFLGGWHWQSLVAGIIEATLLVTSSIWLVGAAERHLAGTGRRVSVWTGAAFAAFVIQGPVLMVLSTVARLLQVPAEVKAPLVAVAAIVLSFWLGGLIAAFFRSRAKVGSGDGRPATALGS